MFSLIGVATGLVAFAIDMGVTFLSKLKFDNTYKCKLPFKWLNWLFIKLYTSFSIDVSNTIKHMKIRSNFLRSSVSQLYWK